MSFEKSFRTIASDAGHRFPRLSHVQIRTFATMEVGNRSRLNSEDDSMMILWIYLDID
jgi:hypothetical protein